LSILKLADKRPFQTDSNTAACKNGRQVETEQFALVRKSDAVQ